MAKSTKGLGRGLGAIFEIAGGSSSAPTPAPEQQAPAAAPAARKAVPASEGGGMKLVELTLIRPNPNQPRTLFDEETLQELADSISALGVIQPVTLKVEPDGFYTIISGERRWRAAQKVGLTAIPAYLREVSDQNLHEMALVENLQREDLNPLEVAMSLQRLVDECSLTQDILSERVGKKRSTIANYMRLLRLPLEVQAALRADHISMGHAKAIASLPTADQQLWLLGRVMKGNLSVRQTEQAASQLSDPPVRNAPAESFDEELPEAYSRLVESLERVFGPNIGIKKVKKGVSRITIDVESDALLEPMLKKLSKIK